MKQISKLFLLPLILACNVSLANTSMSIGFGAQHGGAYGIQHAFRSDSGIHKFHASVSTMFFLGYGIGVGYEYFLSPNISLGASYFDLLWLERTQGTALHANYYFNSDSKRGLWIGLEAISTDDNYGTNDETSFALGYRF